MILKVMHFNEVEDFANLCGFKFTKKAIELVEKYKKELENIEVVSPKKHKKVEEKDGLQEILNSGSDVLDDLKD